ncbi:hypothetical protein [Paenibacillus sp. NPDC058174]|uniref:hypothetical protein n=1 Tax=Paenibacillus sp. NPDC058174 TaxID=3346366 RepID=UPI0036DAC838
MDRKIVVKLTNLIGYTASISTILLWIIFVWVNPYGPGLEKTSAFITFMMLVLPAVIFGTGLMLEKSMILLAAYIWSFPYSMYMVVTPGVFMLFGMTSFIYFICFMMYRLRGVKY